MTLVAVVLYASALVSGLLMVLSLACLIANLSIMQAKNQQYQPG